MTPQDNADVTGTASGPTPPRGLPSYLRQYRKLIIGCTVGVTLLLVIPTLIAPRTYTGSAMIMFPTAGATGALGGLLPQQGNDLPSLSIMDGMMNIPQPGTNPDTAQIILRTRRIRLELIEAFQLKKRWSVGTETALSLFTSALKMKSGDSGDLRLDFTDPDPKLSIAVLNKTLEILERESKALSLDPALRYEEYMKKSQKDAEAEFSRRLKQMEAFLTKNEAIPPSSKADLLAKNYFGVESDLLRAETEASARTLTAERLSSVAMRMVDKYLDPNLSAAAPSLLSTLYSQQVQQEANLALLRKQYTETHPDVVAAKRTVDETQRQIQREVNRLVQGMGEGENPFIARDIVAAVAAKTTVDGLKKTRDDLRKQLNALPSRGTDYVYIQMELETARAKVAQLRTEMTKAKGFTESRSRVFIVPEPPIVPSDPNPRGTGMRLILGLILGLLVGAAYPYSQWYRSMPKVKQETFG